MFIRFIEERSFVSDMDASLAFFDECTEKVRWAGSSVGIATGYGLDGPGIESLVGVRFFAHIQAGLGTHPASCTMGTGTFPVVKRPGRGADHPPPSSAEVTKR
jgi:hypothetical protein